MQQIELKTTDSDKVVKNHQELMNDCSSEYDNIPTFPYSHTSSVYH